MEDIDLAPYVTRTRLSLAQALLVGERLLKAAPAIDIGERGRAAIAGIGEALASGRLASRGRLSPDVARIRPIAIHLGSLWVAARWAIEANARLDGEIGQRAQMLLAKALPQGTRFVKTTAEKLWIASGDHLARLDELGLAARIDELIGPAFLVQIREAQARLVDALGIGATEHEVPDVDAVDAARNALADAFVEYGRAMIGWVDRDDSASVATFRKAMRPLDDHRARLGAGGKTAEEDLDTDVVDADPEDGPTDVPIPTPVEPAA